MSSVVIDPDGRWTVWIPRFHDHVVQYLMGLPRNLATLQALRIVLGSEMIAMASNGYCISFVARF